MSLNLSAILTDIAPLLPFLSNDISGLENNPELGSTLGNLSMSDENSSSSTGAPVQSPSHSKSPLETSAVVGTELDSNAAPSNPAIMRIRSLSRRNSSNALVTNLRRESIASIKSPPYSPRMSLANIPLMDDSEAGPSQVTNITGSLLGTARKALLSKSMSRPSLNSISRGSLLDYSNELTTSSQPPQVSSTMQLKSAPMWISGSSSLAKTLQPPVNAYFTPSDEPTNTTSSVDAGAGVGSVPFSTTDLLLSPSSMSHRDSFLSLQMALQNQSSGQLSRRESLRAISARGSSSSSFAIASAPQSPRQSNSDDPGSAPQAFSQESTFGSMPPTPQQPNFRASSSFRRESLPSFSAGGLPPRPDMRRGSSMSYVVSEFDPNQAEEVMSGHQTAGTDSASLNDVPQSGLVPVEMIDAALIGLLRIAGRFQDLLEPAAPSKQQERRDSLSLQQRRLSRLSSSFRNESAVAASGLDEINLDSSASVNQSAAASAVPESVNVTMSRNDIVIISSLVETLAAAWTTSSLIDGMYPRQGSEDGFDPESLRRPSILQQTGSSVEEGEALSQFLNPSSQGFGRPGSSPPILARSVTARQSIKPKSTKAETKEELEKSFAKHPTLFDAATRDYVSTLVNQRLPQGSSSATGAAPSSSDDAKQTGSKDAKPASAAAAARERMKAVGARMAAAVFGSSSSPSSASSANTRSHSTTHKKHTTTEISPDVSIINALSIIPESADTIFLRNLEELDYDVFQSHSKLIQATCSSNKSKEKVDDSKQVSAVDFVASAAGFSNLHVPSSTLTSSPGQADPLFHRLSDPMNVGEGAHLLVVVACSIFERTGLVSDLNLDRSVLATFFSTIARKYHVDGGVPYHNALHATDVLQAAYHSLMRGQLISHLNPEQRFAFLVAAACHDVGHLGVNNVYLVDSHHPLSLTYNDVSPLENMHAAVTFLTMQNPKCNILEPLKPDARIRVRQLIISMILATDNVHHFVVVKRLKKRVEKFKNKFAAFTMDEELDDSSEEEVTNTSPSDASIGIDFKAQPKEASLFLSALLHACDISNNARPWHIATEWTSRIMEEFFRQGDKMREEKEKDPGFVLPQMHDRKNPIPRARMQAGFIAALVLPLWRTFTEMPFSEKIDVHHIVDKLEETLHHYTDITLKA
jgi:3'5'-cyclic nucleotide phosphodiesterase